MNDSHNIQVCDHNVTFKNEGKLEAPVDASLSIAIGHKFQKERSYLTYLSHYA